MPGPEFQALRQAECEKCAALAGCLERPFGARLAAMAEDGGEIFLGGDHEKDRNYFWHGKHLSSGAGGEDQQHEGGRGEGGSGTGGWGEDGGGERIPGDNRSHLAGYSLLSRVPEECGAGGDDCDQQSFLVDGGRQVFQLRACLEAGSGDSADGASAAQPASPGHDGPLDAQPDVSAELG